VSFEAAQGERNVLSIVHETDAVVLRDAGASITPGAGCAAIDGGVRCSSTFVVAHLGDGDDVATADRLADHGLSAFIYGDAGDDRITGREGMFSGGPGDDVVTGTTLLDEDGPTPGHDTYIGVARTFRDGEHGATLSYQTRVDDIRADLRPGRQGEDRISGVSDIRGGKGDDVLIGDSQPNVIYGEDGYGRVLGLGGNDRRYSVSGVEGGEFPESEGFRIELRL
jgi:hypothetical protein